MRASDSHDTPPGVVVPPGAPDAADGDLGRLQPPAFLTLRTLREERGLSLREVEAAYGVSRPVLSRIERSVEMPSAALLMTLSDAYGVPLEGWYSAFEFRIPRGLVETPTTSKEDDHDRTDPTGARPGN